MDEALIQTYRYIVNIVLNKYRIYYDREEFEQIGMIALWQALENFDESKGALEPYLYSMVRFTISKVLQKKYVEMEHTEIRDERFRFISSNEHESCFIKLVVQEILSDLTEEDRSIIRLSYFYGLTNKEIAKMLGKSEESIKKKRTRIIKRLQQKCANI